jgi:hypothetical protein
MSSETVTELRPERRDHLIPLCRQTARWAADNAEKFRFIAQLQTLHRQRNLVRFVPEAAIAPSDLRPRPADCRLGRLPSSRGQASYDIRYEPRGGADLLAIVFCGQPQRRVEPIWLCCDHTISFD